MSSLSEVPLSTLACELFERLEELDLADPSKDDIDWAKAWEAMDAELAETSNYNAFMAVLYEIAGRPHDE